jgi:selenocysteine lyase/cysteine desulfurase
VRIDMNQPTAPRKDAIFISPHKFIGGPGTPGLLIAKRALFRNRVPTQPGGGTVAYVSPVEHLYLSEPTHREEGGTPAIIERSARASCSSSRRRWAPSASRPARELPGTAIASWHGHPSIRVLGNPTRGGCRLVSRVRGPPRRREMYLHHNFVVALLNDLFGIQARGGCSCAGPYGHRLLGIDSRVRTPSSVPSWPATRGSNPAGCA